jgi:hypothetical protein
MMVSGLLDRIIGKTKKHKAQQEHTFYFMLLKSARYITISTSRTGPCCAGSGSISHKPGNITRHLM